MTDCPSERIRPNLTCLGLFTFLLFSFWNWKTFTAAAVAVVVVALLLRLAVKIIANYGQQLAASNVGYAAGATCKTRKKQQQQQQQLQYQQHQKQQQQQLKHIVYNAFFIWESRVLPFWFFISLLFIGFVFVFVVCILLLLLLLLLVFVVANFHFTRWHFLTDVSQRLWTLHVCRRCCRPCRRQATVLPYLLCPLYPSSFSFSSSFAQLHLPFLQTCPNPLAKANCFSWRCFKCDCLVAVVVVVACCCCCLDWQVTTYYWHIVSSLVVAVAVVAATLALFIYANFVRCFNFWFYR